jgi:DUF4097 and DUF4098 domain-containing protein YvlB
MSSESLEQTFNVVSPARLKLSNIRGSVDILPGEPGILTVTATKSSEYGDVSRTKIAMSQSPDGLVTVETRYQDAWWGFFSFSKPCKVDYQVHIPPTCEVDASCVSSSLAVSGLDGKFKLSTVSGEMRLENLSGEIKLSGVSGETGGSGLAGVLHLNTVSGEVRLVNSALTSSDLTTVSGEIRLQTTLTEGPYRFHSVSGSVWLSVPADTRCSLELQSISGGVHVNLPVTRQKIGGRHYSYEVQGGGVRVTANSVSGGLYVESSSGSSQGSIPTDTVEDDELSFTELPPLPPQPPVPPLPAQPPEPVLDRAAVLDRIERGEMSVEEGLKALEKLA